MNEYSTAINKYQILINQKDIEIKHLKSQLNNHNTTLNNDIKFCNYVDFNEIVCVNFLSSDNDIHFAISCLKSNTFAEIEEKLYLHYPQYRETNNKFVADGKQVLRFKTIDENKLGNGLPVTLILPS